MVRRLAAILALALLIPAGAAATALPAGRTQQLRQIEAQERQIRGLSQLHSVRAEFPGDTAFNALISGQMRQDNPLSEVAISQREMDEVGFLHPGQSLRTILFSDMSSQVAGVYDYNKKILYVRGHDNQAFNLERYVLVHEYTHALQDQHWHLAKILPDEYKLHYRNSDEVTARHALVEGDATNTQNLYVTRNYSLSQFRAMITYERGLPTGPTLPWAIQKQFYFPYTTGLAFVQALYETGGMAEINSAFSRLPSSTYEIIFPKSYLAHWHPTPVTLHGVAGFKGWKQVDDDVFGALGYEMLLWQHSTENAARNALRTYRGDRYIFLERGRAGLLLMKSRWSSPTAARQASRNLAQSLEKRFGSRARWNAAHTAVSAPGLTSSIRTSGDTVTLAYGPTKILATRLVRAATT